jgi:cardiolipin synthase
MIWTHSPRSKRFVVFVTAGLSVLAVIVARNFMGGEKSVQRRIPHLYSLHDSAFDRAMGLALGPSIVGGNHVVALLNGDETFPAMLQAIRGSQKTITLETYIYWAGEIGEKFAVALSERARAGVKVHVLVDWVGSSKMDERYVAMMEQAGVALRKYRPLRWYNLGRVNKRTHRKLLVVDGRIGFTGGVGSRTSGPGTRKTPRIGGTRISEPRAPWWRRCKPPLWTTGSRPLARCSMATTISRLWRPLGLWRPNSSTVRLPAAAKPWS